MPRSSRTPSLARLLDQCPDPVYVVDSRRRIVFANAALLEWTGLRKEDVVGRAVEYHAQDRPASAPGIAKGLCPPPTAFAGQSVAGHVSCLSRDGQIEYRIGHFVPLGSAEVALEMQPVAKTADSVQGDSQRCVGVLAVLGPQVFTAAELTQRARAEPTSEELHAAVAQLRQRRTIRGAGAALVGDSDAMRRSRRQVELAAQSRSPVLVAGSDPWQRRRVAETIPYVHPSGSREAVIPLESPLLDENLLSWSLESLADRGKEPLTLLLHDVHELSAAAQEFLADRIARWPEEWRVIATCVDAAADDSTPRQLDSRLFHWLTTIVIDLPPLSARIDDLPIVCQYLIEEQNAGGGKQVGGFSQAALDRMHLFDWPEGLAQLGEVVAAAHTATRGAEVSPTDLPPTLRHAETAAAFPPESAEPIELEAMLASIETSLIQRALAHADGNKTQAAALLGMTRPRLYRRMEQLGVE